MSAGALATSSGLNLEAVLPLRPPAGTVRVRPAVSARSAPMPSPEAEWLMHTGIAWNGRAITLARIVSGPTVLTFPAGQGTAARDQVQRVLGSAASDGAIGSRRCPRPLYSGGDVGAVAAGHGLGCPGDYIGRVAGEKDDGGSNGSAGSHGMPRSRLGSGWRIR